MCEECGPELENWPMNNNEYVLKNHTRHPLPRTEASAQYDTCLEVVREQIDSALINITDIEQWLQDVQYMLNQARTHACQWLYNKDREQYDYDDG